MLNWIGYLIIGLLAGAIAGRIVQGRGFGLIGNIIVGVIGALVGGFLFQLAGIAGRAGVRWFIDHRYSGGNSLFAGA